MTTGKGRRYESRKVGELVTLRVGAAPTLNRCRKLNCSVPRSPSHPPDRLGVRSSSDCPAAVSARSGATVTATASPMLGRGRRMMCYCVTCLDTISPGGLSSSGFGGRLQSFERRVLPDDVEQLVHRLRHRPARQRDADRLEDLTGGDTPLCRERPQGLLDSLWRPVHTPQRRDAGLERATVCDRILCDLLLRLFVELHKLRIEPHRNLTRHVEGGAGARLHGGDRLEDCVFPAVHAEGGELRLDNWVELVSRFCGEILAVHPLELGRVEHRRFLEDAL